MPPNAFTYKSAFLNPHLAKNHLDGQNPVHTPTFNINVTKITTPQDSKNIPLRVQLTLKDTPYVYR
jgi:hypothetical protein